MYSSNDGLDKIYIDLARLIILPIIHMQTNIINSVTAEEILHDTMHGLDHEEVWCLFLNASHSCLGKQMLSRGTLTQTSIDCRTVIKPALLVNATAVILLHNHPSGNPLPSFKDMEFTKRLKNACSLFEIDLIDHIIIGKDGFFSFADERTLKY